MENLKINQTGITEILLEDENGLKQGKYFKYENGRIKEEGQYKDSKKDGKWTYYVIEQNRCLLQKEENYKDGQLHGEYKEFYLYGGIKIEAQYKEGKLEGNYKSYWEHGQLKEKGQYKDGKKEGNWRTENGHSWENISYKNGLKEGEYERLLDGKEKGLLFTKGQYIEGKKEGEWITEDEDKSNIIFENYKNGKKYELDKIETRYHTYLGKLNENGEKEGEWTLIAKDNSYKIVENYKDGVREGLSRHYDKDGKLTEEGENKNNREVGEWKYYKNGILEKIISNVENFESGYKEFYENGQLKEEGTKKFNRNIGAYKSYYENGQLKEEGQYKDGKKDGKWNEYPIDEKKIREKTYIDGEIISERVIKKNFLDSIKNMITKSISNENSEMKIKRKIIKKSKEEELEL